MDVDAYVAAHRAEWDRLGRLVARRGRLDGEEVDELVGLYQRVATHLSVVRSASPDPELVGRLSTLVARARSAVTGAHNPAWKDLARFFTVVFPAAVFRAWRWWAAVAVLSLAVAVLAGAWVAGSPQAQAAVGTQAEIRRLVEVDFEEYYSANPAASFAGQVWTNNAWVAAACIASGIGLGLYPVYILAQNALNVGVAGGLMAAAGRLDLFFGLILPHGLLELTAVFVAGGVGIRLGWTIIDPGPRTRAQALAEEGRAAIAIALGLVVVLLLSGVIEAFVTPSGLPTWGRIAIGVAALTVFLLYVVVLGGRAVRAGEIGDLASDELADRLPTAA
jgi:uncharacterized membrane protein SpoIIM required for sporulation